MPVNAFTGNAYNGINLVSLWVSAEMQGYSASVWATYRQWSELGAQVRKGETSSLVIFYKEFDTEPRPDDADDDGKRRVARASYVFNASQVEGFTSPGAAEPLGPVDRIAAADHFKPAPMDADRERRGTSGCGTEARRAKRPGAAGSRGRSP